MLARHASFLTHFFEPCVFSFTPLGGAGILLSDLTLGPAFRNVVDRALDSDRFTHFLVFVTPLLRREPKIFVAGAF